MPEIEKDFQKKVEDSENTSTKWNPVDYLREMTSVNVRKIINACDNRENQVQKIISGIKWRNNRPEDLENLRKAIMSCEEIANDDEFHENIMELVEPFIVDVAQRSEEFFKINGILIYGINEDSSSVHVHMQPDTETDKLTFKEKEKLLIDGFKKLAEIVDKEAKIQKITAMTPMAARAPKWMMSLGFSEPVPVTENEWKEYFIYEYQNNIPVSYSEISRVDFLNKYLKK